MVSEDEVVSCCQTRENENNNTFSVQFVIRTKKSNPKDAIIYARINANKNWNTKNVR